MMLHERIDINEHAYFDTYLLNNSKEYNVGQKRPLVVVCPGGGYAFTSDREAEPMALKFNSIGLNSLVLWYTTEDKVLAVPNNALKELAKTIKYVRNHAEEWLVDTNHIIVCGFSAGGHLALQMATKWNDPQLAAEINATNEEIKVDRAILGYPVVYQNQAFAKDEYGFAAKLIEDPLTANERWFGTESPTHNDIAHFNLLNFVNQETPPVFIWHTTEDALVDVNHSLLLGIVLRKYKIPFEMLIFEKGEHGLALADRTTARKASHLNPHVYHWFDMCQEWLSPYIDN